MGKRYGVPPCHQASNQAPPSPPLATKLVLSPPCYLISIKPLHHPTPCIATLLALPNHPTSFLSHYSIALDPYSKYSWPPSSKSDQGGSREAPRSELKPRTKRRKPLKSFLGVTEHLVAQSGMDLKMAKLCNVIVLTWIMIVVSQDVYMGLVYSENVATMWKELNETYDKVDGSVPVRSSLLTRDPLPEVNDAYNVVSRRQFNNNNNFTRGSASNVNRGPNPNLNCFKRNSNTFKQTFNANADIKMNDKPSTSSLSSGFAPEQMQKLLSMINDKSSGSIHANMAGRASFFNGNVSFNIKFLEYFYANSILSMTTITMGWIIDSRANQYLTVSITEMYNIMDISELKIIVGHPNGTLATINHVGNLKLTNNVILYDILVVPGYCVSLLSVNKLIRDSKMFVGFDENKCYIQELKREKVLGTSSESGGLYLFDMNNSYFIGKSNVILFLHVSKLLWHNRLGHPADQVLFVVKKDLSISENTFVPMCEVCQRAKQTREPFPLSDHKSKTLGELFHLDLWGPYRVNSREGYRYLLTVVDDYSRVV
ncbi:ribonuclease H-like domain-containing protein [Tanacetum coccineum]